MKTARSNTDRTFRFVNFVLRSFGAICDVKKGKMLTDRDKKQVEGSSKIGISSPTFVMKI